MKPIIRTWYVIRLLLIILASITGIILIGLTFIPRYILTGTKFDTRYWERFMQNQWNDIAYKMSNT